MFTTGAAHQTAESFRDLLLRRRGRTGLTQRELAARVGANRRTIQEWEAGTTYPSTDRLRSLVAALLEVAGLTEGREAVEAQELWAAALRDSPRLHTPFDEPWFGRLLANREASQQASEQARNGTSAVAATTLAEVRHAEQREHWGDAPDVLGFVGRVDELATVREWVLQEHCRLAGVVGMGGIGKTSMVGKLAQDVAPDFQRVYWRSLRNAPPASEWLSEAIAFLSDQQVEPPDTEAKQLASLLQLLRDRRSLLVLDNFETLLEPGQREGSYRDGFAGYGALLRIVGETSHQSCMLVTSREVPTELGAFGGQSVHTLELGGLGVPEAQIVLADKRLIGDAEVWADLVGRFAGNGLALKIVGDTIRQLFGGDIAGLLQASGSGAVFGGIRRLLAEQLERSSTVEQNVLRVLAVEREPVKLADLVAELGPRVGRGAVLEALEALRRRSLVERAQLAGAAAFTLQSVVLEFVTDRLVEEVSAEIARGRPDLLVQHPLIQAQAKDYVRDIQERLIGRQVLQLLLAETDKAGTEQLLLTLLEGWRGRPINAQGFGPGNVVNLLRLLRGDLCGLDLSHLAIRQAYLANVEARDSSMVNADLSESVLAEAFNLAGSVALTSDGAMLAAGTFTGQVCMWRLADRTPLWIRQGHIGGVWTVALSADGQLVASTGADGLVRLWQTGSGHEVATLSGHVGTVGGVALSADGRLVASGGDDGTVRLWDATTGQELSSLTGHTGAVWRVALSADGRLVASGGDDATVRLWDAVHGRQLAALEGHTGAVWRVALSADGRLVASGATDGSVRLWQAVPPDDVGDDDGAGQTPASMHRDGAHPDVWRPLATLTGHTGAVWGVALTPDGGLVASGDESGRVRLWAAASGDLVASGGSDGLVRLWRPVSGALLATLTGNAGGVWGVALSTAGHLVVSGGDDGALRVWTRPLDVHWLLSRGTLERFGVSRSPPTAIWSPVEARTGPFDFGTRGAGAPSAY